MYVGLLRPRLNLNVHGGTGGAGGQGGEQGGGGGTGEGAIVNAGPGTIVVREKGTGGWLLAANVFKQWKSQSGRTLWCRGMPGAGKTVLVSMVVDDLSAECQNNRDIGVACIYLNHKEVHNQTPSKLLAGLWRQLVLNRDIGSDAKKLYERHREKGTAPSLEEVASVLSSSLKEFQRLDIHAMEDDLRKYVDAQIGSPPRLRTHVRKQSGLQEEIHSKINTQTVDGMFLLAKLHIQSLSTKNTIKALQEAMKELPKSLDDSYDIAMQRIDDQTEEDKNIARSTLIWVANAKRPLNRLDKDNVPDINIILSVCAGLVIVDKESSVVRLVHYTTQEYLDKIQAKQFPDAQTDITRTLLTFLTFDGYPDSSWNSGNLPPLADYSQYCLAHAAGEPEVQLREILLKFLGQAFQWMNILNSTRSQRPVWDSLPWEYSDQPSQPSALWIAAAANLVETTKFLLQGTPSLQHSKDQEITVASYCGHEEIVGLLLEKGANVNAAGRYHGSSLQAAAAQGHTELVSLLLEKGADINAAGGGYGSSLQAAAARSYTEIVAILLEKGADINAAGGGYGSSLQAAADGGHTELVSLLLEKGADINAAGGRYGSPLQAAADGGHTELVSLLLEKGADINAAGGHYGAHCKLLLMEVTQSSSASFLIRAAADGGHTELVSLLLERGADINAAGGYYGSSLQAAAAGGHTEVVGLLLEKGTDVNAAGGLYGSSLQAAAARGHTEIVGLLLEKGATFPE
ncbi:ankyrin repeat-containing domain protein [Mycena alexandri]|uniref:Ankyrin repeat-containing domain protein n=1 Tax=Mycena alexandri TaxID=1745969 RepID=A0AAD6T3C3_9AGAR|nr:ankyrin repeat-containing domain protein [Mycena alexandri]